MSRKQNVPNVADWQSAVKANRDQAIAAASAVPAIAGNRDACLLLAFIFRVYAQLAGQTYYDKTSRTNKPADGVSPSMLARAAWDLGMTDPQALPGRPGDKVRYKRSNDAVAALVDAKVCQKRGMYVVPSDGVDRPTRNSGFFAGYAEAIAGLK